MTKEPKKGKNYRYKTQLHVQAVSFKKKIYVPVHLELFPSKHGNCLVSH